jgi:hypothetical protein
MNYVKASGLWLVFLVVAMAGGIIRERFLAPGLGPLAGKALGTLLVAVIIFGIIYAYVGKLAGASQTSLFKLGLFWTTATITFEFLFGHYAMGHSWESLWADYNVVQGRLWPLVLIVTLCGPWLARKIRN